MSNSSLGFVQIIFPGNDYHFIATINYVYQISLCFQSLVVSMILQLSTASTVHATSVLH